LAKAAIDTSHSIDLDHPDLGGCPVAASHLRSDAAIPA
jgi:hypothetical protein